MIKNRWFLYGVVALLLIVGKISQAQDSLGMSRVSTLDYWGYINGIQMVGDMAYIVSHNVLRLINLADPAQPVELGQVSWCDIYSGSSVCIIGDLAYVSTGYKVIVVDVSEPRHPITLVEWIPWSGCELEYFLALGDIAFLGIIDGGRYIVDISNLGNIHIVSGSLPSTFCCPIAMVGEYVCFGGVGLSMWDFSDPNIPVQVARIDTQFSIGATTICGNYAYACSFWDGLRIIDISNPLQLFEVGACDSGHCEAITVTDNHAVVSKGDHLNIWNVTNPAQPVYESTFGPEVIHRNSLASSGNTVCAGKMDAYSPSLMVIDITDPYSPNEISTLGTKGFFYRMAVSGTIGYLAGSGAVLHTVDLNNPREAVELGMSNEESPHGSLDLAIRGDFAYTASGSSGLLVYDISNPALPESITADIQSTECIQRIIIVGDYAYVIDGYSGMPFWLRTFSLIDPAAPECVNTLHITNYASGYFGYEASNGYLYIGEGWDFYVYSLANPAAPELVGSCDLPPVLEFAVRDITLLDRYAYVAYKNGGLLIIDVGDPTNPTEVGSVLESTWAVAARDNTLITFGSNGLSVKDVTDRLHPVTVGYYYYNAMIERVRDMDILGEYLLTVGGGKFWVYQCDALNALAQPEEITPHEFALQPCYPNPFNSTLVIPFTLPIQSKATITIYNILGQQVYQFESSPLSPGAHQFLWDATSRASGLYIIQLTSGNRELNQQALLLK